MWKEASGRKSVLAVDYDTTKDAAAPFRRGIFNLRVFTRVETSGSMVDGSGLQRIIDAFAADHVHFPDRQVGPSMP